MDCCPKLLVLLNQRNNISVLLEYGPNGSLEGFFGYININLTPKPRMLALKEDRMINAIIFIFQDL